MRSFLGVLVLLSIASWSTISFAQGPDEYWLGLEEYAVHTEGDLAGMTTWRLYLNTVNTDDFLSACTGNTDYPWILESTSTPAWYQHPTASETFATQINSAFFTAFPNLEFDSWLSLGVEDSSLGLDILSLADPIYNAFEAFELGVNISANTPVGNGWVTLFPGIGVSSPAYAGDDLKILIGQITTAGTLSGSIYVQIFPNGIQSPDLRLLLPIVYAPSQCMDINACNYDAIAWTNADCVYGPSAGIITGEDAVLIQAGTSEWTYSCDGAADSFNWTVVDGDIISGQGTSTIVVDWQTNFSGNATGSVSVEAIGLDGCAGVESSMVVNIVVGISEIDIENELTLFPSPASSELILRLKGGIVSAQTDVTIYSVTGQKILELKLINGIATLDVSGLSNGNYVVVANTDLGIVRKSFVVSK